MPGVGRILGQAEPLQLVLVDGDCPAFILACVVARRLDSERQFTVWPSGEVRVVAGFVAGEVLVPGDVEAILVNDDALSPSFCLGYSL